MYSDNELRILKLLCLFVCYLSSVLSSRGQGSQTLVYSYVVPAGGYDPASNLVQVQDSVNGNASYGYDSLNRLTSGLITTSGAASQYLCWSYDSFGNRTSQIVSRALTTISNGICSTSMDSIHTVDTARYEDVSNRLTAVDGAPTSTNYYDAAGNVQQTSDHTYLYDEDGRLCAVLNPSPAGGGAVVGTQYVYDAEGRRIAKGTIYQLSCDRTTNGFSPTDISTRTYVLDQTGNQVTELDGKRNWQHTNVFVAGQMLATYDVAGLHFNVTDALGTKRLQTSATGQPELNCLSMPFGNGDPCVQVGKVAEASEQRYTGKERDTESGLDNFGARYYASSMGRFMSPDSTGYSGLTNPQSWNLYAYTLNNPLRYIDPTGHTVQNVCTDTAACTAAVAAATGNAEAASRVGSETTVTHHNFLGIKWDTSVTNITISGDIGSFRALSANASHLADLVGSSQNFTVDIRDQGYFTNDRQGAQGTGALSSQFQYAGGFTQTPSMTGNNDGNVYIKWNPGPDDVANEAGIERIPGANRGEAMAHELLGHQWGEVFGGHMIGTAANKQDAVNAENAVRATDPTRGQKAQHDHYH